MSTGVSPVDGERRAPAGDPASVGESDDTVRVTFEVTAVDPAGRWLDARAVSPRRRLARRVGPPLAGTVAGAAVWVSGAVPVWATPWFLLGVGAAAGLAGRLQARRRRQLADRLEAWEG
jgi:hypothetical protein